jgi:hypothetical protein
MYLNMKCNCIDLRPSYRFCDWPSIFYLTNPRGGSAKFLCQVCGLGMPGADITLRIDGGYIGRTTVNEDGKWCFERDRLPLLAKGDHSIKVVHDDHIGAPETAYANFYTWNGDDPGTSGNTTADRETYCTSNDPELRIFRFTMEPQVECFKTADFCTGSPPPGLAIAGTFVNPNGLLRHRLRFSIESTDGDYAPYIWYEDINTQGAYGDWALLEPNNGLLYPDICAAINSTLWPASSSRSFCMNVKDMTTGATDDYCFCIQKTT